MDRRAVAATLLIIGLACAPGPSDDPQEAPAGRLERAPYAIAIHGGAGKIERDLPDERRAGYLASLERALRLGRSVLESGGRSLDAVEQVVRMMEDDPLFNAGKGAVFNHEARHELDASIMDGETLGCGAVANVTTVKNPIGLARLVMERTPHVLLAAAGAERFADEIGVERVSQDYYYTDRRWRALQRVLAEEEPARDSGTVGVVALDRRGNLAAGTSTGGLTNKRFGRVGDSPIVGAGTFADNRSCAVSATGKGEEFIRHGVARSIATLMQLEGLGLQQSADRVIHGVLKPGDGGVIAVDRHGRVAMSFNTAGMLRGAADSSGRFEVRIWE